MTDETTATEEEVNTPAAEDTKEDAPEQEAE